MIKSTCVISILLFSMGAKASIMTPIDFFVDASVLEDYSKEEVITKIQSDVKFNNDALEKSEVDVRRSINDITFIKSNGEFKDPSMELSALLSPKENHSGIFSLFSEGEKAYEAINKVKRTKKPSYRVILGYPRGPLYNCGSAPSHKSGYLGYDNRIAVIAFDTLGKCSDPWLLTHELGHIDGLGHTSEVCGKENNIMAEKVIGNRTTFSGAGLCTSKNRVDHTAFMKDSYDYFRYIERKHRPVFKPISINPVRVDVTETKMALQDDGRMAIEVQFTHNSRTSISKTIFAISTEIDPKGNIKRRKQTLRRITLNPRNKKRNSVLLQYKTPQELNAFALIVSGRGRISIE